MEPSKVTYPTNTIQGWPSGLDTELSKNVDRTYGDPVAPYIKGDRNIGEVPKAAVIAWANRDTAMTPKIRPMTSDEAEEIHKQWIAAERTPVAKLGFSPGKMLRTEKADLTVAGMYDKAADQIWFDSQYKSTPVHESIHRGIQMLRKEDLLPKTGVKEEYLVRALMLRHYGDIEAGRGEAGDKQVEIAKSVLKEDLDAVEKAAADYIAKKRPGGPR